jgi:hypothetical protein
MQEVSGREPAEQSCKEKWLQQQITADVEIVGLVAELTFRNVERGQRGADRLALARMN